MFIKPYIKSVELLLLLLQLLLELLEVPLTQGELVAQLPQSQKTDFKKKYLSKTKFPQTEHYI